MATEKRLIDANALMEAIDFEYDLNYGEILTDPVKFADMVDDAPTVDAVEVVHSQWDTVFYERNGTLASYSHICPKCKYFYRDVHFKGYNYCPNCGADMRGDGNA